MSAISVVTSCSAKGWEEYGKRFVSSFKQHWPVEIDLYVVSEDDLTELSSDRHRVWFRHLENEFLTKYKDAPWVHGSSKVRPPRGVAPNLRHGQGEGFRFNAYKFSKKVFAIELIAQTLKKGRLFWIDADVVTFAPVPVNLLDDMLPDGYAISCLDRGTHYHSECGFVGYNLDDPEAFKFILTFAAMYDSDTVFELPEWHDSWVFDWVRKKLKTHTYAIPHKSNSHPFINSELGKYLDHMKGKRKAKGRSEKVEQLLHRNIPYWKET